MTWIRFFEKVEPGTGRFLLTTGPFSRLGPLGNLYVRPSWETTYRTSFKLAGPTEPRYKKEGLFL